MRKLLALAVALLTLGAFGCDRGFPDEAPPTGKSEQNGASSKTSLFGPTRPNVSFSNDVVVSTDAGEEEDL